MTAGIQLNLGIDYAPQRMRDHGLREAHTYPLVSEGKIADGDYVSWRVPASEAWDFPEVEQRTPTSYPLLILDLDGRDAVDRLHGAMFGQAVVPPSWMVTRRSSGGVHAFWALKRPILRGPDARRRPLAAFARVAEWYAGYLHADAGFAGVLAHNATYPGGEFATDWLTPEAFSLTALARPIPKDWRRPSQAELRSAVGRNCALFDAGSRWGGSIHNHGRPVLPELQQLNARFSDPLPDSEVETIARSIERYRAGQTYYEHTSELQADRGRRSGQARRSRTAERDAAILAAVERGEPQVKVAAAFGMSQQAVSKIVRRDAVPMPVQLALLTTTEPTQTPAKQGL